MVTCYKLLHTEMINAIYRPLQGRYYLSAETLIDMKNWVARLRTAIRSSGGGVRGVGRGVGRAGEQLSHAPAGGAGGSGRAEEPEYASIKDYRLQRSNSMSTLPSLCGEAGQGRWTGQPGRRGSPARCLNRSMHEDIDHNLTYSYSSSEDSLNESFSINFTPKKPRSAEATMHRAAPQLHSTTVSPGRPRPEITIATSSPHHLRPGGPGGPGRPTGPLDTAQYLQKMYEDMERVDRQLEMVAKLESGRADIAKFDESEEDMEVVEGVEEIDSAPAQENGQEADQEVGQETAGLRKMEVMMRDLNSQSEELQKMFRALSGKRGSLAGETGRGSPGSGAGEAGLAGLLDSLARYQSTMAGLQGQARAMLQVSHCAQSALHCRM